MCACTLAEEWPGRGAWDKGVQAGVSTGAPHNADQVDMVRAGEWAAEQGPALES